MSDSKLAIWKVLIVCDCLEVFVQDFQDLFFHLFLCVCMCVCVCVCNTMKSSISQNNCAFPVYSEESRNVHADK